MFKTGKQNRNPVPWLRYPTVTVGVECVVQVMVRPVLPLPPLPKPLRLQPLLGFQLPMCLQPQLFQLLQKNLQRKRLSRQRYQLWWKRSRLPSFLFRCWKTDRSSVGLDTRTRIFRFSTGGISRASATSSSSERWGNLQTCRRFQFGPSDLVFRVSQGRILVLADAEVLPFDTETAYLIHIQIFLYVNGAERQQMTLDMLIRSLMSMQSFRDLCRRRRTSIRPMMTRNPMTSICPSVVSCTQITTAAIQLNELIRNW